MKTKYVFSLQMAIYLKKKGHMEIMTIPNKHNPKFIVWVFEETEQLLADMTTYTQGGRNE